MQTAGSQVLIFSGANGRSRSRQRPDSSVVEHFHGKEGVVSSILTRGSGTPTVCTGVLPGGVAQVVRAHGS